MIDFNHRCSKRFQYIIDNPNLKITIHSRPDLKKGIDLNQLIITIDNFVTLEECDILIELGKKEGYK